MSYRGISLTSELVISQLFSLHYFEYMNSFYFPGESHPFWEFVCVDKGDVTIGAGKRSFSLTRGQIAFHEPNEFHWVKAGGKTAPCLIVVSFSSLSPLMEFFRGKILHITEPDRRLLAQIVQEARGFLTGRLDDPYQTSLSVRPGCPCRSGADHPHLSGTIPYRTFPPLYIRRLQDPMGNKRPALSGKRTGTLFFCPRKDNKRKR